MSADTRSARQRQWDQHYAEARDGLFGNAPNEYLRMVAARSDFTAKTALLLADGDGRNSTWLASQGVAVTAVDYSATGMARGAERDAAAGVSVQRITADVESWQPPSGEAWQAAFILYLNGPDSLRRAAVQLAWAALEPEGWLIVESFSKDEPSKQPEVVWSLEELCGWLPEMKVVEAFAGETFLNEGIRHYGPTKVIRFAGRKQGA